MAAPSSRSAAATIEVAGREVVVTNPAKVVFPALDGREPITKLDLVRYYLAVADGALRGVRDRPMILKRYVKGIASEAFFQKRAPDTRPDWVPTARLQYRRGTYADEVVVTDAAVLAWVVNLGCVDLNPHPVRAHDLDHPDELRIDLDPVPGIEWAQIVDVALLVREVLAEHGLVGWPKTSGSRGFHIYTAVEPRWTFPQLRLAAQTVAREVEARGGGIATSRWWKEERQGVFVDFNQNAKDRTVASAYSVRAVDDARVSAPLDWAEVPGCRPETLTVPTVLERFAAGGDPWAGMDATVGGLDSLLTRAQELGPAEKAPVPRDERPLIEIARARTKAEALEGLDRWRGRHAEVAARLEPADVLVDGMRGRSSLWYRIRVNLERIAEEDRPPQEPLEVDYDPWQGWAPGRPPA